MSNPARRLAQSGTGWAVGSPHTAASAAAAASFNRGGNAVDAALSAAAMLTVVYPNQCSMGGDLVALVGTPDGRAHVVNASGRAPAAIDVNAVASANGSMPVSGPLTVTVPGVISGWQAMSDRWGNAPLADALADAEAAAADGIAVAPGLARALCLEQARILSDPGLRAVFAPAGEVLTTGLTLRQPALADSLALVAEHGSMVMYEGDLGRALVRELRARGSSMSVDDFANHRVEFGETASAMFAGLEYVSTTSNTQGLFFLEALRALELLRDGSAIPDPLGRHAGRVASVLAIAAADRDRLLSDPGPDPEVIDQLLSDQNARRLAQGSPPAAVATAPAATGDTVAITTADSGGLWVSLIQSVFHAFGSGICEPTTGIVLQNRGASFSLLPGAVNRLAGGRRPPHTLMPLLVRREGRLVGAHGAMGGRAQPQIHAQLALHLAAGATPEAAIASPRWILGALEAGGPLNSTLQARLEADVPDAAERAIGATGLATQRVSPNNDDAGHAQLVRATVAGDGTATFSCATDPRADGEALVGAPL